MPEPGTERLQALEEEVERLRQREQVGREEIERLRAVLDRLPFPVYVKDQDGRFLVANAASGDHYGIPARKLVGMLQSETHMDAQQCERVRRADLSLIEGKERHFSPAYPIWRSDGEMRRMDMTKLRLLDPVMGQPCVLVVARDVTDTPAGDTSARQQDRLSALGQTVAQVAHDLRTPLATLGTSMALLRSRVDMDSPRVRSIIERVERTLWRCDGIIEDLLDFTRDGELSYVDTDVDAWLAQLVEDAPINFPIVVERRLTLDGLHARIDRARMARAITNVLMNACEALYACERGRKGKRCHLTLATHVDREHVVIDVEDDGPGIADEIQAQITRSLFTTKPLGVGLGLAIADDALQRHGGGLSISSEPRHGTLVSLWFPVNGGDETLPFTGKS